MPRPVHAFRCCAREAPAQRGSFLVPRFGNMLPKPHDVGFDVLQVKLIDEIGEARKAEVQTFLKPVARPVEIHLSGGKVYLVEYMRELSLSGPGKGSAGTSVGIIA